MTDFKKSILQGIPNKIPPTYNYNKEINHAPKEKIYYQLKKKN